MFRSLHKYRLVYHHLWQTYGQSWAVRIAFVLQIVARICKLIVLPVAISLIITRLSKTDFTGAQKAVFLYAGFSLILGILTPLIRYIGLLPLTTFHGSYPQIWIISIPIWQATSLPPQGNT
jgi:hypothetical protein